MMGTASTVLAASAGREDHSGIFTYIFLGFCALVVVAQLAPAILLMVGMAKGTVKGNEAAQEN
jgi:hypothetical protein